MVYKKLDPDKPLIWRITHRQDLPLILASNLHVANSDFAELGEYWQPGAD